MSQPQMLTERPPFVMFETESVENREATIAAGHYVGRDVDFAYITPAGSKDRIVRIVSEWFEKLSEDQAAGRVPQAWVESFKASYKAYKEGSHAPTSGTSIANWPGLSPTVVKTLQSLHLLSIEDVAAANEECIARMGMGGRALKQRAVDYLAAANDVGKVAEEASALRAQLADEKARREILEARTEQMQAQLNQLLQASAMVGQVYGGASTAQGNGITLTDILDDSPGQRL